MIVEGKSRVDAAHADVRLKIKPPAAVPEDQNGNPILTDPTVLVSTWQRAIYDETPQGKKAAAPKKKFDLKNVVTAAAEADDDVADDRARECQLPLLRFVCATSLCSADLGTVQQVPLLSPHCPGTSRKLSGRMNSAYSGLRSSNAHARSCSLDCQSSSKPAACRSSSSG